MRLATTATTLMASTPDMWGGPVHNPTEPTDLEPLLAALAELADRERRIAVDLLAQRWSAARLRVMLLGEAKRGKSTVANCLLRRAVMPTGVLPLTSIATTVRAGTPERIEVDLLDGTIRVAGLDALAAFVTEARNPHNVERVRAVTVYLESPLPHPRMELVDTPGLGSVHEHNTAETADAMQSMDIAIVVLTADPPPSAAERALLARIRGLAAHVIVVLNKIDQLEPEDREGALGFTRQVVREVFGAKVAEVVPMSAKTAMRAAVGNDDEGDDGGLPRLVSLLTHRLDTHASEDLLNSIATAAQRVSTQLHDEATLRLAAVQLRRAQEEGRLAAFRTHLERLDQRGEDAVAAALTQLDRCRADLDRAAEAAVAAGSPSLREGLRRRLEQEPGATVDDLERLGWEFLNDAVPAMVEPFLDTWRRHVSAAAHRAIRSGRELLDEAIADVALAAQQLLGVRLSAAAPDVPVAPIAVLRYDIEPETGWNSALVGSARRHVPGQWGRRREIDRLELEAGRMVDKHIGRVRAGLAGHVRELRIRLAGDLRDACSIRRNQLSAAISLAGDAVSEAAVESVAEAALSLEIGRLAQLDARLAALADAGRACEPGHAVSSLA